MAPLCNTLRRRECAVFAFTVSVFAVIAFASVSLEQPLAAARHPYVSEARLAFKRMSAATGLPGWISELNEARSLSALQPDEPAADSSDIAADISEEPGSSSANSEDALVEPNSHTEDPVEAPTGRDADSRDTATDTSEDPGSSSAKSKDALVEPNSHSEDRREAPVRRAADSSDTAADTSDDPGSSSADSEDAIVEPNSRSEDPAEAPVAAVEPAAPAQAPDLAPAPAPDLASAPAPGPDVPGPDPRWLAGAASDLRECMKDDRDGDPATIEGILAGELPRQVRQRHPAACLCMASPTIRHQCQCSGSPACVDVGRFKPHSFGVTGVLSICPPPRCCVAHRHTAPSTERYRRIY